METRKPSGRTVGATTWKKYRWELVMFNNETKQFTTGKFCSVRHLNESLGTNFSPEFVNRLHTMNKVDTTRKMKDNSFLNKWGHIRITKIDEDIVKPTTKSSKRPNPQEDNIF